MIREERPQGRSHERPNYGSMYLLTGAFIGMVIGLIFSLAIAPLRYKDATPEILDTNSQKIYKILIAQTYAAEKDMGRAQARWSTFHADNMTIDLNTIMVNILSEAGRSPEYMALEKLLFDLSGAGSEDAGETQPTPTPEDTSQELEPTEVAMENDTPAPEAAATTPAEGEDEGEAALPEETQPPIPTSTVVAALSKPFQLEERLVLCEQSAPRQLQIDVKDEDGTPLQGVPIQISWSTGSEVFYTGLYPALDNGYADFEMNENETYRVQVGMSGMVVDGLSVNACEQNDGTSFTGGWWLSFQP